MSENNKLGAVDVSSIKDMVLDNFQITVQELLVRNKSILDQMSKLQESNADINRAITKSVTNCGCISVNATKQRFNDDDTDLAHIDSKIKTHLEGELCENCRDMVEKEIGKNLFYLASISNTLGLNLYDIIIREDDRVRMLGRFSMR